jgi:hypothetical protein
MLVLNTSDWRPVLLQEAANISGGDSSAFSPDGKLLAFNTGGIDQQGARSPHMYASTTQIPGSHTVN